MVRTETNYLRVANALCDLGAFTAAFLAGVLARLNISLLGTSLFEHFDVRDLLILGFLFLMFNSASLYWTGVYPVKRLRRFDATAAAYLHSVLVALVMLFCTVILIRPFFSVQISRLLLGTASGAAFLLLVLKEACLRGYLKRERRIGTGLRNVLIIGDDPAQTKAVAGQLEAEELLGMRVQGVLTVEREAADPSAGVEALGNLARLLVVLDERAIDSVIFVDFKEQASAYQAALLECEKRGLEVWVKLAILDRKITSVCVENIGTAPFLNLRSGPQDAWWLFAKYALDRVLSLLLLLLLAPLMLAIALAVRLSSPGPVVIGQTRVGLNGRPFRFYKFRSMVQDADRQRERLKARNEMTGPVFKISDDPRITPLGRLLRKFSLDELPQLWNVLKGEMSLVGPRPLLSVEIERVGGAQRRRLSMKPGITCVWQVSGRSEIKDFEEWVRLDLYYIDNWSIWLDFWLLLKTVPAVISARGAR